MPLAPAMLAPLAPPTDRDRALALIREKNKDLQTTHLTGNRRRENMSTDRTKWSDTTTLIEINMLGLVLGIYRYEGPH